MAVSAVVGTMRLHRISAKSEVMMEKELLIAVPPTIWCGR